MTDTGIFDPLTIDEAGNLASQLSEASQDEFQVADHLHHLCVQQPVLSPSWRVLDSLARTYGAMIADVADLLHDLAACASRKMDFGRGEAGMA